MSLVKFISKSFMVLCYCKSNRFFPMGFISIEIGVFCILSLYPKTLLNSRNNCGSFCVNFLELST